jgi:hypothetical protein
MVVVACALTFPAARAQETPPLEFVTEYLREFSAIESIRSAEERELQAPHQSMLATCIESGNRYRVEITRQMTRMGGMRVQPPSQAVPGRLVDLYGQKLGIYKEVVSACAALGREAYTNVSSLEVMAAVSRYNAKVDAIDRSLFQTSTDAFLTLLNRASGASNASRRLSITLAEKKNLLRQMEAEFGKELDDDRQTYLVNAASVIRDAIRSHKAADE